MRVHIPSPLRSYTGGESEVSADGATVDEVLWDLDRQFRGLRYRMVDEQRRVRRHMRVFINGAQTFELDDAVAPTDRVEIHQALSGG